MGAGLSITADALPTTMNHLRRHHESGSAILLALWAILVMSGLLFVVTRELDGRFQSLDRVNEEIYARAMALSGVELGTSNGLTAEDPRLQQDLGEGLRFEVELTGEGGRLNPNWIAADPEGERYLVLENYLINHEAELEEAQFFTNALLDYIDADDLARINGMEENEDYLPRNAPLMSLDELMDVAGSEVLARIPNWRDDFTLHSAGRIDVHWASRDLLLAVPGLDELGIDRLIEVRESEEDENGEPLIPGEVIKSETEMALLLGLSEAGMQEVSGFLTVQDPTKRLVSTGFARGDEHTIEVVFRAGNRQQVMEWIE